jgi:hypothetical protein
MKLRVPNLLAKFYKKHDPAAHLHEINTKDLPELDALYRDNSTGIVWKVLAHSGGDIHVVDFGGYAYGEITSLRKEDNEPERLVILQSVEPEGATMHVTPYAFKSRIHSMDHYKVVVKAEPDIERFTKLAELEDDGIPFWQRGVKTLTTQQTLQALSQESTTSLHVINVYATKHGLADLLIEYLDENAVTREPKIAKVEATWLPQDLLESVPKQALLKSQTFRRFLDGGFIKVIRSASVGRIMATPEAEVEVERMNKRNAKMIYPN